MGRTSTAEKTEGGAAVATVNKPVDGLENKAAKEAAEDLIKKFQKAYTPLLANARACAEMTSTDRWQQLYQSRRLWFKAGRLTIVDGLERLTKQIREGSLTPDEIKSGKDYFKSYEENRDAEAAFDRTTIAEVRDAAERCRICRQHYLNEAASVERDNALTMRGVSAAVAADIEWHPEVKWDAETGQVVIG